MTMHRARSSAKFNGALPIYTSWRPCIISTFSTPLLMAVLGNCHTLQVTAAWECVQQCPAVCWCGQWTKLTVWALTPPSSPIFVTWLDHSFPICFKVNNSPSKKYAEFKDYFHLSGEIGPPMVLLVTLPLWQWDTSLLLWTHSQVPLTFIFKHLVYWKWVY